MQIGWDILWFIVGVGGLVVVHEYGHFWVARKLGFKVLRFSVGFGKPLFRYVSRHPDKTEFVIAALPLGGYVKLVDERDGPVDPGDVSRSYQSKRPWQRILMLLAGPGANFLFAILVLWGIFYVSGVARLKPEVAEVTAGSPAADAGLRAGDDIRRINGVRVSDQVDASLGLLDAVSGGGRAVIDVLDRNGAERTVTLTVTDPAERHRLTEPPADNLYAGLGFEFLMAKLPAVLGTVTPGGPAANAGLQPGDLITAIDSSPVRSFNELADYVNARPGESMELTIKRGEESFTRRVTTARHEEKDGRVIGRLMVAPSETARPVIPPGLKVRVEVGPVAALGHALDRSWQMTAGQAVFFGRMLTGKFSLKNLSSPIGIAGFAGDSARAGPEVFLMFLVLISLSLGFLNLLPIPILDGGQILFAATEWLKGSPLSERAQAFGWHAGLLMLVLLMSVAVFNDLSSRFG
jgi:regulator of sigma E protease